MRNALDAVVDLVCVALGEEAERLRVDAGAAGGPGTPAPPGSAAVSTSSAAQIKVPTQGSPDETAPSVLDIAVEPFQGRGVSGEFVAGVAADETQNIPINLARRRAARWSW